MKKKKNLLVGITKPDGHTRITKADDFRVFGGTQEIHEIMTEHTAKISEKLQEKPDMTPEEFKEIVDKVVNG